MYALINYVLGLESAMPARIPVQSVTMPNIETACDGRGHPPGYPFNEDTIIDRRLHRLLKHLLEL